MSDSRKAVIHVINKFKVKKQNQAFRCIMVYQDLDTGFCFIRPLLYKIDLEIVVELFKIFTSYGPPAEIHVNSCTQEMVDNMDSCMKALCPDFNINFIKKNADNNDIAMEVVKKLHSWMEANSKEEWEIGCPIVQREINTAVSAGTFLSPHERFFKELGKVNTFTVVTECTNTFADIVQEQNRSNITQEQNKSNVTLELNRSNVTQEQNRSNVTQEQNRSNVTQEQNIRPNVKQEQNVANVNSAAEKKSVSLLNKSLETIKIKQEIVDSDEEMGGLILPCLNEENVQNVEVKIETLDTKEDFSS